MDGYDAETGLYYYRARYFDPRLGRFLSEDPLGFRAGDTNLSRYVGNSPGNGVDPTGMFVDDLGTYKPALMLAASQAAQFSQREIIIGAISRPIVVKTLIAALAAAGVVEYVRYYSHEEGIKLAVASSLRSLFGLATAIFLTAKTSGAPIDASDPDIKEQLDPDLWIGREERRRRQCDLNDPRTWTLIGSKQDRHTAPNCKFGVPGGNRAPSCFPSRQFADFVTLQACVLGARHLTPREGGAEDRRYCFPHPVGTDGPTGVETNCVTCRIRLRSCAYHGFPDLRLQDGGSLGD